MFSLPSIPDNIHKIFLALSLVGLYFSWNYVFNTPDKSVKETENYFKQSEALIDSLNVISYQMESINAKTLSDSLNKISKGITEEQKEYFKNSIREAKHRLAVESSRFEHYSSLYDSYTANHKLLIHINKSKGLAANITYYVSMAMFLISVYYMFRRTQIEEELFLSEHRAKMYKPFCQSCGKRFTSMVKAPVTNEGEKISSFCSNCHDGTDFIDMSMTKEKVYNNIISELSLTQNKDKAKVKKLVNSLERWARTRYF